MVLSLGVIATGCSASGSSTAPSDSKVSQPKATLSPAARAHLAKQVKTGVQSLLGVLNAGQGTFSNGTLVLSNIDPVALTFTDRPARAASLSEIPSFLSTFWTGQTPPNVAIQLVGAPTSADAAILMLADPHYDSVAKTLSFQATIIPPSNAAIVSHWIGLRKQVALADKALPSSFGRSVLFVDDATSGSLRSLLQTAETQLIGNTPYPTWSIAQQLQKEYGFARSACYQYVQHILPELQKVRVAGIAAQSELASGQPVTVQEVKAAFAVAEQGELFSRNIVTQFHEHCP